MQASLDMGVLRRITPRNMTTTKRAREFTDSSVVTAVRLPDELRVAARSKAKRDDLTFSQLMRRALRRELGLINTGHLN
jgi:hypothetical protein